MNLRAFCVALSVLLAAAAIVARENIDVVENAVCKETNCQNCVAIVLPDDACGANSPGKCWVVQCTSNTVVTTCERNGTARGTDSDQVCIVDYTKTLGGPCLTCKRWISTGCAYHDNSCDYNTLPLCSGLGFVSENATSLTFPCAAPPSP